MSGITVLVIGGGAREHAISAAYEKSSSVKRIIVSPGNDFIACNRSKEVLIDKECSLKDAALILESAKRNRADLVDVAQDDAIASGAADLLAKHGFEVFGPAREAARIEWDKAWAREFMQRHGIPAPDFAVFGSEEKAVRHASSIYKGDPKAVLYVKASGLCAGKGALKCSSLEEAIANIKRMRGFGDAGKEFLVEQGLAGVEFSHYAICDGKGFKAFRCAQDNKRALNFDEGEQTGGMGAISPVRIIVPYIEDIEKNLIKKAVKGMQIEGIPYKGILYLGGIITDGKPVNIEYNARWGDPECQAVLPSLGTDYLEIVHASVKGNLDKITIIEDGKARVCVVGASKGYPGECSGVKGKRIYGLEHAMKMEGVSIFGAAIKIIDGKFYADGGRLFSIVGEGRSVIEARQKAYSAISLISVEGNNLHYRTDIGWRDAEEIRKITG